MAQIMQCQQFLNLYNISFQLFLISKVTLYNLYSGQFTQLVEPGLVFSGDVATYQCTRSGSLISWTITPTCGGTDTISRSYAYFNVIGLTNTVRLCNSNLIFNLTSITSSSISSTLTIDRPLPLSGTTITCADQTVQLMVLTSKLLYVT